MPRLVPSRPAAACALALALVFALGLCASASGKGPMAHLRVVGAGGKALAEKAVSAAGDVRVKTSQRATCFGAGTGGSGRAVSVKGPSALSALARAARSTASLRPLRLTDAFSFGLGLCGVGPAEATKKLSWYLKIDHVSPQVGGEAARVRAGDEVLWALVPYPYPDELSLVAPRVANAGQPFEVQVFAYDEKGKKKPVAGATVTGGSAPTGSDGKTTVTLQTAQMLFARHGDDIPSNGAFVCAGGSGVLC